MVQYQFGGGNHRMHRKLERTFGGRAGKWNALDGSQARQDETSSGSFRFTLFHRFRYGLFNRFRLRLYQRLNGRGLRPNLLRAGLCLEQTAESEPIVFFLITLFVRLRAELPAARETFKEGQLLSAIQASHEPLIGSYGG